MSGIGKIMTGQERYKAWLAAVDGESAAELRVIENDQKAVEDRFGTELAFGTGGLRGVLGVGTNRMNVYVVRRATRGLAAYIKKSGLPLSAAISYDSRINSRLFAETAAETLAACGIDAWLYPRLEPTPALSWAVRTLGCGGGIMITASHNPAEYNGYKVYGPDGCQITDSAAAGILHEIQRQDYFDALPAVDEEKIHTIPENVLDRFVETELSVTPECLDGLRVVYTPLNGAGLECVKRALEKAGAEEVIVVPEQEQPDGRFPTCPKPNPEERAAMELGLALCEKRRPDLLLATDPDCDRVGTAVPDGDGFRLLNGNEMGILLFDYICRVRTEKGTMPRDPVAVTTVVSTEMADAVAARYGVELRRTLTGFKYIGEQIGMLEKNGESDRFIFGFEESYGYLTGAHVRDKDAVNASLTICSMAAYYKRRGKSLVQVLQELREEYGAYTEKLLSFQFPGADGAAKMGAIMERLREAPPEKIGGAAVRSVVDYKKSGETGLPASNVLAFRLGNGDRVTVRPSGTEPKMKIYLSVRRTAQAESERAAEELAETVKRLVFSEPEKRLTQDSGRWSSLIQFIKFCIVGASNAVVNLAVYYLIVFFNSSWYLAANVIAWLVSVLNAFFWNNRLVFKGGSKDWRSIGTRLLKTYVAYAATMLLGTVLLHFEVQVWGISELIAPIINICITTPINFVTNKFWAFANRKGRDI